MKECILCNPIGTGINRQNITLCERHKRRLTKLSGRAMFAVSALGDRIVGDNVISDNAANGIILRERYSNDPSFPEEAVRWRAA